MNVVISLPRALPILAEVSTGAVGLIWVVTLLLRKKSAALRHFLWLLAVCAPLLAMPLAWVHPRIAIPILRPTQVRDHAEDLTIENVGAQPGALSGPVRGTSTEAAPMPMGESGHELKMSMNPWIAVWLAGMAIVVIRMLRSELAIRRLLVSKCSPAPEALMARLNEGRRQIKLTRRVRMMVTHLTEIPFCHGVFRNTVVFPASWEEWDEERIRVCVAHELAHLVRRDLPAMLAGQMSCALCWFNPLIWMAAGKMRDEAEKSADDLVLATNVKPERYAASLVAITERYRASALSATISLSMARPARLRYRVEAILDSKLRRESPGLQVTLTASVLAAGLLCAAMIVRLTAAPTPAGPSRQVNFEAMSPEEWVGVYDMATDAIKRGDTAAISSLLDAGFNIETGMESDSSPLFWAVADGQMGVVKLLVARGAKLNAKTSWGDDPTNRACWQGFKDIADFLIKAGGRVKDVHYGAGVGDVAYLEAREKKQPVTPKEARDAISYSVAAGNINTFDWLWEKLAPMDEKAKVGLLNHFCASAADWGQLGMLQHLEKRGAVLSQFGTQALENAASGNYPNIVKYLLDEGVSANALPPGRRDPLLRNAAGDGYIDVVRLLVEHGADVNVKSLQGMTALNWAACSGKEEVCMLLLDHGADGRITDDGGRNAAWRAVEGGCPDALQVMIRKGVNVTTPDKRGETIFACMPGAPSPSRLAFLSSVYSPAETAGFDEREKRIVDMLAAAGVDVNGVKGAKTPLMKAIDAGNPAAAMALMDDGADMKIKDDDGANAFRHLLSRAEVAPQLLSLVEPMLKRGADPNEAIAPVKDSPEMLRTNLQWAIEAAPSRYPAQMADFQKAVKLLLDYGGKFPGTKNAQEQKLLVAAAEGDLKGMQDAVAHGVSVNATDSTGMAALLVSTAMGYYDETRWLIDHGADANGGPLLGGTPLDYAVAADQDGLVDLLISKGARPDNLDSAIQSGDQHIFDALLKAGASPGEGTIYDCIGSGRVGMARTLLDRGADPQPPSSDGRGDGNVYYAVYSGDAEILKLLLDHGADPTLKNSDGDTPLALAQRQSWNKNMVPMLEEAIKRRAAAKQD